MVVKVTIRFPIEFVAADMLEQFSTFSTHETLWMESLAHGANYTADNRVGTAGTDNGRGRVDACDGGL
jgi:hypothetical protein